MITGVVIAFSLAFVQSTSAAYMYLGKSVCQDIWNAAANNLDIDQEVSVNADARDRKGINAPVSGDLFQLEPKSNVKILHSQEFQTFRDLLTSYVWQKDQSGYREMNIKSTNTRAKAISFLTQLINHKGGPVEQGFKYLKKRGLLPLVTTLHDFQKTLEKMWFGDPFGENRGFMHTFVGDKETYSKDYAGFHNWYQFYLEMKRGRIQNVYMGYDLVHEDTQPPFMPTIYFDWNTYEKDHGSSMFVGTSPDFEIALYSVCFIEYPGQLCTCHIGRSRVTVQTYPKRDGPYNQPILDEIATAYPTEVEIERNRCAPYDPAYRTNCGWTGISNSECKSRGCCYDFIQSNPKRCFYPRDHKCDGIDPSDRNDCGLALRHQCERVKHCCFDYSVANVPFCFKGNL